MIANGCNTCVHNDNGLCNRLGFMISDKWKCKKWENSNMEEIKVNEDAINHPSHYNYGKIEVIDFIEDQNLNFNLGNAIKYICRAGRKDPNKTAEDLGKAMFYIEHEIQRIGKDD